MENLNLEGYRLKEFLLKVGANILIGIGALGLIATIFFSFPEEEKRGLSIQLTQKDPYTITINGDTTRRLYLINDTSTKIVWVGVGGKVMTR